MSNIAAIVAREILDSRGIRPWRSTSACRTMRAAAPRSPRALDFSIEQVRALVAIVQDPNSSCMDARDMAAEHLTTVRAKMRELKALEKSLIAFVTSCETSCAGGPGPDCVILDDLTKPRTSDRHRARRVSSPS